MPLKLLGSWLALQAVAAASKLEGRLAREVDIRDAHHLTPLGDAPCPEGDLFAFWREAARLRLTGRDWRADEKGLVRNAIAYDVSRWIEKGLLRPDDIPVVQEDTKDAAGDGNQA